jgi:hypothetical protein
VVVWEEGGAGDVEGPRRRTSNAGRESKSLSFLKNLKHNEKNVILKC